MTLGLPEEKGKVILEQTNCPRCPSSDAFTVYLENGRKNAHCYSCKYNENPYKESSQLDQNLTDADSNLNSLTSQYYSRVATTNKLSLPQCLEHPIREIKNRSLSYSTCEHYGVRIGVDTKDGITPIYHLYPYYDEDGELSGFKKRVCKDKLFSIIGSVPASSLFGSNVVKPTGNKLFITEGEIDCLSVYQALKENSNIDWDPSVVSIPHGSSSAAKSISENLDLINGYDQVILVFDQDAPGKQATKEVCKILAGKVYMAKLSLKDPNEMLMCGKELDLKWAVLKNIKKYQPDGIIPAKDCWERYKTVQNTPCYPYPPSMQGLNDKLYGARPGSVIVVTSGTGGGKTQILRELKYHYLLTTDFKIADIALEEDIGDSVGGLMSLHLNKRIMLPDVEISIEQEERAFKELFGNDRVTFYDHFGGMDDDNLFSKLNYFASTGHNLIFLDHLSIIVSEFASQGGERERIDTIMTKLAKLVKSTGVTVFLVVHLRKGEASTKSFEQGAVPTLDDLRGSGAIKQLAWDIIGISRDQQHEDRRKANTAGLHVLKSRFTGRTGPAGYIRFDDLTGRYISSEGW